MFLNDFDFGDLNVVKLEWKEEANYVSQINFGITNSTSQWISLFEFDDDRGYS